jgi:hypothetical protein
MSLLSAWVNFYVIVGTAAGALIGLTFVVISLVAGRVGRAVRSGLSSGGVGVYNTPTVVHFTAALLACATLSAPWPALAPVALLLGLGGLGGVAYIAVVARRLARWEYYTPVAEDWAFHVVLPLAAYAALPTTTPPGWPSHGSAVRKATWTRHSPPSEHRQAGRSSAPARRHLTLGARTGALNSRRGARFAVHQWRRSVRAAKPARRLVIVSATSSPFGDAILPKRPLAYASLPSGGPQALLAYVFPEMMA